MFSSEETDLCTQRRESWHQSSAAASLSCLRAPMLPRGTGVTTTSMNTRSSKVALVNRRTLTCFQLRASTSTKYDTTDLQLEVATGCTNIKPMQEPLVVGDMQILPKHVGWMGCPPTPKHAASVSSGRVLPGCARQTHQFSSGLNVTEEKGGWPKLK